MITMNKSMEAACRIANDLLAGMANGNLDSYDPVDLHETSLGRASKALWNKGSKLGLLLAIPIQLIDILIPQVRNILSNKRKQPICYAQAGISCLLLSQTTLGDQKHITYANHCLEQLLLMSRETNSGIGWGINVEWLTKGGEIPANTPCHTQTSYCFEFIDLFNKLYPNSEFLKYLHQISEHVSYDYQEFIDENTGMEISGYSMIDKRPVINAMSYRSLVLFYSYELFKNKNYLDKANQALEFVLQSQESSGEWYYSSEEKFIDGYHTCFVLKNLHSIRDVLKRLDADDRLIIRVGNAFAKGVSYYKSNLFDSHGFPIPFAMTNKPVLYEYDAYDLAEAVNLFSIIGEDDQVKNLLGFFVQKMRTRKGMMKFRYYKGLSYLLDGVSFNRYANTAMLLALSKYIYSRENKDEKHSH